MKLPFLSSLLRVTANWKVITKITAGFGSVIAVFIVVLALSFWNFVTIGMKWKKWRVLQSSLA